jgi:hypothetical protein
MNIGSLRKRLARLEKITKVQIEAAALATAPAPELSQEEEERQMLAFLRLSRMCHTAEQKVEFERLRALYPYEEDTRSLDELMQEVDELCRSGEWSRP